MAKTNLSEISTRPPKDLEKSTVKKKNEELLDEIRELQNLLYAASSHSLLVVIQGMDASGKDGAIREVFKSVNPQGVMVKSFKVPTPDEAAHDFLWRIHLHAPAKGMIQVFNRSHYEDILVTRVHKWCSDELARKRMDAINDFERLLQEHGRTTILKFYLHVSKDEQQTRLHERLEDVTKQWKYNEKDFEEAALWDEYMRMYEDCFEHCDKVPWIIVPSDKNWYKEHVMLQQIRDALTGLHMQFPGLKKE